MSLFYGKGIIKSMLLVFKHFIDTFGVDFKDRQQHKKNQEKVAFRSSSRSNGLFTLEYPEQRREMPEEFRVLPFLIYDELEGGEKKQRCTACGTCARVCPTQCIWIVRGSDPETGKPKPFPLEFHIDGNQCMNCGFCAEFCPFNAIRMDHDYELASRDRKNYLFNLESLSKPASYYEKIRPAQAAREAKPKQILDEG